MSIDISACEDYYKEVLQFAKDLDKEIAKIVEERGEVPEHLLAKAKFNPERNEIFSFEKQLWEQLEYLRNYSDRKTRCKLWKDFAPYSFYFVMETLEDNGAGPVWERWFNGGLIFHGPHDRGGDGGAPTFSVNLTPHLGWSVHT